MNENVLLLRRRDGAIFSIIESSDWRLRLENKDTHYRRWVTKNDILIKYLALAAMA